jgi:hypothetical protein
MELNQGERNVMADVVKIKDLLVNYYQALKKDNGKNYQPESARSKIASECRVILNILDKIDQQINIDDKIFSFLNFISGYDTPRYEDSEYLYNNIDLEREYRMLENIDMIEGIEYLLELG